jgi:hypothetical protein
LVAIVFIFLFPGRSFSQISYGIKGGFNFATVTDSRISNNYSVGTFYHAGVFLMLPAGNKISIKAEILFSGKGASFPSSATNGAGTLQLKYLSTPVMVSYNFHRKLSLELGPELNYLISAKEHTGNSSVDVSSIWDNKFDVCIDAGISYKLNSRLSTSLRYSYGLSGIIRAMVNRTSAYNPSYENYYKNRVLQITFAYVLNRRETELKK